MVDRSEGRGPASERAGPARPATRAERHGTSDGNDGSSITYGPVPSRRYGRSLGVDLLVPGHRTCRLRCVYCQLAAELGPERTGGDAGGDAGRLPPPGRVVSAIRAALVDPLPDAIVFSGSGEPTLHSDFGEIVGRVADLRAERAPAARLVCLTGGTELARPDVRVAAESLDELVVKLDAGDELTYRRVNSPARPAPLAQTIEQARDLPNVVIQTCLVGGPEGNATPRAISRWIEAVGRVDPIRVDLYTCQEPTAATAVPRAVLERAARAARDRWGLPVHVA